MSNEVRVHVEEVDEVEVGPVEETLDEAAYKLWRKAVKTGTWDPAEIDLSEDKEQYEQLDEPTRVYLERFCSAFYNAEENVAVLFCPWIMAASGLWQQAFLSTQLVEEFKHTDFFDRYFKEVFGEEKRQGHWRIRYTTLWRSAANDWWVPLTARMKTAPCASSKE